MFTRALCSLVVVLLIIQLILAQSSSDSEACNLKWVSQDRGVCVCNASSCPGLVFSWPRQAGSAKLIQSSRSGARFSSQLIDADNSTSGFDSVGLQVDLSDEKQSILGWGGAFTDAATINIFSLSPDAAQRLLASYFGRTGLRYNIGRVPIAGTDLSTRQYTYDDTTDDFGLAEWALQEEDVNYKIPAIRIAMEMASSIGTKIKFFGSPWSAPKWMKDNNSLVRGHLINNATVYSSYANYIVNFYEAYRKNGIRFWGGTVQNEPIASYLPFYNFNSMPYKAEEMIKFVGDYLGPALEASGYTRDNFKLMIGDDSLGLIDTQVPQVIKDEKVQRYVSGLAFHWYTSGIVPYSQLDSVLSKSDYQFEFVLMSEASNGAFPALTKVDLGSWDRAEAYGNDIVEDLMHGTGGWVDWNMALNGQGGPSWVKNYLDSPIIVDQEKDEFYQQPTYHMLGHFGRFFKPGSVRIATKLSSEWADLKTVAVHNKETGHVVVNVLNRSSSKRKVNLVVKSTEGQTTKSFAVDGKSINTVVLKL